MVVLTSGKNYDKFQTVKGKMGIEERRLATRDTFGISYMSAKSIRIILVITISFAISLSSACVNYYTVASADFLSPNLGFEAFDQEYLAAANQSGLKIFDSISFFRRVQLGLYPFGLSPHLSSQISFLDQETLVLRC